DVQAGAVAFDIRDDRVARNIEAIVCVDGDLGAAGGHLDVLVVGHGCSSLELLGKSVARKTDGSDARTRIAKLLIIREFDYSRHVARLAKRGGRRRPAQQAFWRALPVLGRRRAADAAGFRRNTG